MKYSHDFCMYLVLREFKESECRSYDTVFEKMAQTVHRLRLSGANSLFQFVHLLASYGFLNQNNGGFLLSPRGREYRDTLLKNPEIQSWLKQPVSESEKTLLT